MSAWEERQYWAGDQPQVTKMRGHTQAAKHNSPAQPSWTFWERDKLEPQTQACVTRAQRERWAQGV